MILIRDQMEQMEKSLKNYITYKAFEIFHILYVCNDWNDESVKRLNLHLLTFFHVWNALTLIAWK